VVGHQTIPNVKDTDLYLMYKAANKGFQEESQQHIGSPWLFLEECKEKDKSK
jgi:hypothetical protein